MKRVLMVCILCVMGVSGVLAQVKDAKSKVKKSRRPVAADEMKLSAGITAGTQGLGVDLILKVDRHLGLRFGVSHLPDVSYNMKGLSMGEISSNISIDSRNFSNFHVYIDYYPFLRSGFRVTGGYGFFAESVGQATVTPVGTYKLNDYPVSAAQLGTAQGSLSWESGISPFLGGGMLFGANNGKRLHVSLDLGTYYLPRPHAELSGTRLLSQNSVNQDEFQENTKDYRWLPVLQLGLSYRFGPKPKSK